MEEKPFYKSKKWWMAMLGYSVPLCLTKFLGIELTTEEITTMVMPVNAYIVGQGMADFGKYKK